MKILKFANYKVEQFAGTFLGLYRLTRAFGGSRMESIKAAFSLSLDACSVPDFWTFTYFQNVRRRRAECKGLSD